VRRSLMFTLEFLRAPVWQGLTWTLLHFLWQGLAVAAVLLLLLGVLGVRRPQIRYLLCLGAMGAMVLCPIVTFCVLVGDAGWGTDRGTGQAEPVAAAGVAVDPGPSLPPDGTTNTFEPSATVATLPLGAVAGQVSEPPLWDRLWGYARAAQPYLLAAWVFGVVCLSARLLLGVVAARWLRCARRAIPSQLAGSVARLSSAVGLRTATRVCVSSRIREAMVVGVLRPMVLLPAAWVTEMTPEILEAIIAHELAHIRRWDLWATLFQRLVETLLFYHPAVWWISRRVSSEREKCCDELAVAATGRRVTYAKALERAAAIRLSPTAPVLGAAFGGRKMAILERVAHVLGMSPARPTQRARWWPVGLLTLLMPLARIIHRGIGLGTFERVAYERGVSWAERAQGPLSPKSAGGRGRRSSSSPQGQLESQAAGEKARTCSLTWR
jgi:beta-lactamase regulating signal transducer with metallopeptidase domain